MTHLFAESSAFSWSIAPWAIAALAFIAIVAAARATNTRHAHRWLIAIRCLAITGCTALLSSPGTWHPGETPAHRPLDIIVDTSASMAQCDDPRDPGQTRLDRARETWLSPASLAAAQQHDAPVNFHELADRLTPLDPSRIPTTEPRGSHTHLWSAIESFTSQPTHGNKQPPPPRDLLVITDGRDTSPTTLPPDLASRLVNSNVRLFAALAGRPGAHDPHAPIRPTIDPPPGLCFDNEPATIRVSLRAPSLAGLPAQIVITDEQSRQEITRAPITLAARWQGDVTFVPARPAHEQAGVTSRLYAARIVVPGREQFERDADIPFVLQLSPRTLRVLMIEGRPTWSSRTIARAIASDPRFEFTSAFAVARPARSGEPPTLRVTTTTPGPQGHETLINDHLDASDSALSRYDLIILGSALDAALEPRARAAIDHRAASSAPMLLTGDAPLAGPRVAVLPAELAHPGPLLAPEDARRWADQFRAAAFAHAGIAELPDLPPITLAAHPAHASQQTPIRLIARIDPDLLASEDPARWTISATLAGTLRSLALTEQPADPSGPRRFITQFTPEADGVARFTLLDQNAVQRASAIVVIRTPDPENDDPSPDHSSIAALATATGGRTLAPADHDDFHTQRRAERTASTTPPRFKPWLLSPWFVAIIGTLFIVEWTARRKRGLP